MANGLLEIYAEELPPSFLLKARNALKDITTKFFEGKKISFENTDIFITSKRIGLLIKALPDFTKKEEIVIIGPPFNISYKDDNPTKALLSFLEKNNANEKDVFKYEKQGGLYVAVKKEVGGKPISDILKDFPNFVIKSLPAKKLMRWDDSNIRFPRPIRNILLILDNKPIYNNYTFGHRFLSSKIYIEDVGIYESLLKEHFVIPRFEERRDIILSLIEKASKELNVSPDFDEELIDEITNLVEYPYLIIGEFDQEFLSLPDMVIKTILAHHQKFVCTKKDNLINNVFFGISNMPDEKGFVKQGYEKVVKARLRDGEFFYQEDLKKPLEFFVNELEGIMFHHKLGTMLNKTNRHIALGDFILEAFNIKIDKHLLNRACYLSMFDLSTNMVKELDELQGYIGMIYSKAKNENIYEALLEQYMPDKIEGLPKTDIGVLLGIILKSDNVVSLISAGEIPKGSSDAYGIKRNIYGIISLILDGGFDINLSLLFKKVYELLEDKSKLLPYEDVISHIENLFKSRLSTYFEDFDYDIVRAVLDIELWFNLKAIKQKINLLQAHKEQTENIARAFKRIRKIIPKDFKASFINSSLFGEDIEHKLFDFTKSLDDMDVDENMIFYISNNKSIIDEFFDKILVMSENIDIRQNRLSLLYMLYKNIEKLANFEHIVVKEV